MTSTTATATTTSVAPVVGAAFVTKKRAAPASSATTTTTSGNGKKRYKNADGEEREFLPNTTAVVSISELAKEEFVSKLQFETVSDDKGVMRYITVLGDDGNRTKGVNFVAKGLKTTKQISKDGLWVGPVIQRWKPNGKEIKNYSFSVNAPVSAELYEAIRCVTPAMLAEKKKKNPDTDLQVGCGPFVEHLVQDMIARPAEVFGSGHTHTGEIQRLVEEDRVSLDKLNATEAKLLKICDTDDEREAQKKENEKDRVKYTTHRAAYDYIFNKIRMSVTPPQPKKSEHGPGFWAPTWKLKVKNNGEDNSDLYPIVTIYDTTSGADDATTTPIYTCDVAPTKKQLDDPKKGPGMVQDWETMHNKVVAQYPNPDDVLELVRGYSEIMLFGTFLGISLTQGFIDISTRVTQIFITKQPNTFSSRRIGEAPVSLFAAATHIEAEATEAAAPEPDDNIQ